MTFYQRRRLVVAPKWCKTIFASMSLGYLTAFVSLANWEYQNKAVGLAPVTMRLMTTDDSCANAAHPFSIAEVLALLRSYLQRSC